MKFIKLKTLESPTDKEVSVKLINADWISNVSEVSKNISSVKLKDAQYSFYVRMPVDEIETLINN